VRLAFKHGASPYSATATGTPLLTIDDTNQKYKELNEFGCLDPAVLSKLAAFSVSPKCVLDAEDMQALVHSRCSAAVLASSADVMIVCQSWRVSIE
jgi:hypothetical protein